jgi:hypothetical protein
VWTKVCDCHRRIFPKSSSLPTQRNRVFRDVGLGSLLRLRRAGRHRKL